MYLFLYTHIRANNRKQAKTRTAYLLFDFRLYFFLLCFRLINFLLDFFCIQLTKFVGTL